MKLFTKDIDQKLFDQYMMGNDLENQMVVAKIFNPYGNGVWYLLNSDPSDPDYLWAIVDLLEVEVGSVSREELETLKVPPFRLGLERDLYFTPMNAKKLYESLLSGEKFEDGGTIDIKQDKAGENWLFPNNPQGETYGIKLAAGGMTAGRWYKDNSGQEFRYIGESQGKLLFKDGEKVVYKDESEFEEAPQEKKRFGFFEDGGMMAKGGSVNSIEKRVAEVNELIKRGNELGIEVIDSSTTWQAPMKFKPLKYTNGVLYVEYEELDLYANNKGMGRNWETKKYKVTKYESAYGGKGEDAGTMQKSVLSDIAKMYRKPLKSYDTYGYFEDGGEVEWKVDYLGSKITHKGKILEDKGDYYVVEVENDSLLFNGDKGTTNVYKSLVTKKMEDGGEMEDGYGLDDDRWFLLEDGFIIKDKLKKPAATKLAEVLNKKNPNKKYSAIFIEDYESDEEYAKGGNIRTLYSQFNKEKPSILLIMIADDVASDFMRQKFDNTIDWDKLSDTEKQKYNEDYKVNKIEFEKYLMSSFVKLYYSDDSIKQKCKGQSQTTISAIKSIMTKFAKEYPKDKYASGGFTSSFSGTPDRRRTTMANGGELTPAQIKASSYRVASPSETREKKKSDRAFIKEEIKKIPKNEMKAIEAYMDNEDLLYPDTMAKGGISKDSTWYQANYKLQNGLDSNMNFSAKSDREAIKLANNQLKRPNAELLNIYLVKGDKYTIVYGDSWESIRDTPEIGNKNTMAKGGELDKTILKNIYKNYDIYKDGKNQEHYSDFNDSVKVRNHIEQTTGLKVLEIKELEIGKNYPDNFSNPYYYDTYEVKLSKGKPFVVERMYGRPRWTGNVAYTNGIDVKDLYKMANGGLTDDEGNLIDFKIQDMVTEYKRPNPNQPKREIGGVGKILEINGAMANVIYSDNLRDFEQWIPLKDLKKVDSKMAKGGGVGFEPYGETKGIYKVYYKADGKPQTEIWETKEMAVNTAKRYSSPQMQGEFTNVKVFDEDGAEVDYMSEAKYAKGGNIESKIKQRLSKSFDLPLQMAVYVPSTKDKNVTISKRELDTRVKDVEGFLAGLFGGFNSVKVDGGFQSSDKGVINEDAVRVVAFSNPEGFEAKFEKLVNKVKAWCREWSQESMGLEFENDLFYIEPDSKFAHGGEIEEDVYNAYVIWIDDNDEAFFDGGWNSIEDAEDRVSDIYYEEEENPKYSVFAVEYDEDYFENKNWDITRMKSYRPYGSKGNQKMAQGGELMKHKYNEHITIELIEPTNKGWKVKQIETHSVGGRKLSTPKEKVAYFSKEELSDLFEPTMARGGRTKFKDKVQSIKASLLKRKKVSPKVQKDYGKTYSPEEAEESAKRIVGSMVKKEKRQPRVSKMLEKMKKGTQLNKKKSTFKDRMKELSNKIKERKSKTTK
jgi:hypothetical protein